MLREATYPPAAVNVLDVSSESMAEGGDSRPEKSENVGMLKQAQEKKARMLEQARDWPVAEGFVLHTGQSPDADGFRKVTPRYLYKVHDEEFYGSESFTFTSEDDVERFESKCRERKAQGSLPAGQA